MLVGDILNKEYRFCDFKEREKSVHYKEIDLDSIMVQGLEIDQDNIIEIVDPDVASKLI